MPTIREKIDNRLKNAHRSLGKVTIYQKEQVKILSKVVNQYEKKYDEAMLKLTGMEHGSEEKNEQQKVVDEISNTIHQYEEAIAQYQMNLKELKAL